MLVDQKEVLDLQQQQQRQQQRAEAAVAAAGAATTAATAAVIGAVLVWVGRHSGYDSGRYHHAYRGSPRSRVGHATGARTIDKTAACYDGDSAFETHATVEVHANVSGAPHLKSSRTHPRMTLRKKGYTRHAEQYHRLGIFSKNIVKYFRGSNIIGLRRPSIRNYFS